MKASDPKAPQVMEWRQEEGEEGNEGGDELSSAAAPTVETTVTHLARSHSAAEAPRSPSGPGFLAKLGKAPRHGGRTPEPTESIMTGRIRRLEQILGRFDPKLTVSQDRKHLAFRFPTNILLMAEDLVTVKNQWKSGVQTFGRELAGIDEHVRPLDFESQKVQESFATQVAEGLGETEERQARH